MNLGAIRAEVEDYLLNTNTDTFSLSWSETELNAYINEAVFYTQQVTEYFQDTANIVCTSSVSTYTASNNVYSFYRMTWDRTFLPQTTQYELDRDDPSWRLASPNNPYRFYFPQFEQSYQIQPYPTPSQNGDQYIASSEFGCVSNFLNASSQPDAVFTQEFGIMIGIDEPNAALVRFLPDYAQNPFTSASGDNGELIIYSTDSLNIGLYYVRIPDTLVNDTDTPQLPLECHYPCVFYALMRAFMREGEFQDIQAAQGWFAAYGDMMESVLEAEKRRWPTRVKSLEPYEEGSLFAKRLNSIGYPMQLDLKPSYGA